MVIERAFAYPSPMYRAGCVSQGIERAELTGLLVACPFGQDNPRSCPLHSVREWPLSERVAWLDSLSEDEVLLLLENHRQCLGVKEQP